MSSPQSILIVEDHPATRTAVTALLRQAFPQSQVLSADCAEAAFAICELTVPALVIMDIGLPGMNGVEATRRIKQQFGATRVVMLTHSDMDVFRHGAVAAGASAFVSKQQVHAQLIDVLHSLLPDTPAGRPA
ncbi:MAG: response regulator transcription factor [Steroidobacteraceae bacterium]